VRYIICCIPNEAVEIIVGDGKVRVLAGTKVDDAIKIIRDFSLIRGGCIVVTSTQVALPYNDRLSAGTEYSFVGGGMCRQYFLV
jgi:hypothetical protein